MAPKRKKHPRQQAAAPQGGSSCEPVAETAALTELHSGLPQKKFGPCKSFAPSTAERRGPPVSPTSGSLLAEVRSWGEKAPHGSPGTQASDSFTAASDTSRIASMRSGPAARSSRDGQGPRCEAVSASEACDEHEAAASATSNGEHSSRNTVASMPVELPVCVELLAAAASSPTSFRKLAVVPVADSVASGTDGSRSSTPQASGASPPRLLIGSSHLVSRNDPTLAKPLERAKKSQAPQPPRSHKNSSYAASRGSSVSSSSPNSGDVTCTLNNTGSPSKSDARGRREHHQLRVSTEDPSTARKPVVRRPSAKQARCRVVLPKKSAAAGPTSLLHLSRQPSPFARDDVAVTPRVPPLANCSSVAVDRVAAERQAKRNDKKEGAGHSRVTTSCTVSPTRKAASVQEPGAVEKRGDGLRCRPFFSGVAPGGADAPTSCDPSAGEAPQSLSMTVLRYTPLMESSISGDKGRKCCLRMSGTSPGLRRLDARGTDKPVHWSVFYPEGIEAQPPVALHYLVLGGWRTLPGGLDYFSHRRLKKGEAIGHTVLWLHNAHPRDRFVFLIDPVEFPSDEEPSRWQALRSRLFGDPPAFARAKWKLAKETKLKWGEVPSINLPDGSVRMGQSASLERQFDRESSVASRISQGSSGSLGRELLSHRLAPTPYTRGGSSQGTLHLPHFDNSHAAVPSASSGALGLGPHPQRNPFNATAPMSASSSTSTGSVLRGIGMHDAEEEPSETGQRVGASALLEASHGSTSRWGPPPPVNTSPVIGSQPALAAAATHRPSRRHGVEVIEILHSDITALDYSPRLSSSRLSIETKVAYGYLFGNAEDVFHYYRCAYTHDTSATHLGRVNHASGADDSAAGSHNAELRMGHSESDSATAHGSAGSASQFRRTEARTLSSPTAQKVQSFTSGDAPLPQIAPFAISPVTQGRLSAAQFDTIVTIYSEDPHFNAVLREVLLPEPGTFPYTATLQEQRRMLSMYETGMPTWTVFIASYGLPYRRALRLVFVGLVNIWPIISLFVGLYDLYKHMPQLRVFLSGTLAPLTDWVEQRVTLRVSMLVTYLLTVTLTTVSSLSAFGHSLVVSYIPFMHWPLLLVYTAFNVVYYPLSFCYALLWTLSAIGLSFVSLLWLTLKLILTWPFILVGELGSLDLIFGATKATSATVVEGTSLTLKWWRAWQEFWVTIASPVKNLAKAWYDSIVHLALSLARREASIRRWYTPKLRSIRRVVDVVIDIVVVNIWLFWVLTSGMLHFGGVFVLLVVACWFAMHSVTALTTVEW